MSKKYTFEEMAKLIAKEIRKATKEFEKAEVVFEERLGDKEMQVERQGESSDYEPKVGDLGYFWDDDNDCAVLGVLDHIFNDGDRNDYKLKNYCAYQNFSKEPPMHLFEKKEEVKKVGYESIVYMSDIDFELAIDRNSVDCYENLLFIVNTINNLDPNKSDNNTDYYEIYPTRDNNLGLGWSSVKKPTVFYTMEAAEHALRHFGGIWRGFYGLKRENEE